MNERNEKNKFRYQCATHVLQKCLDASNAEHVKGGIRVNCKASCTIRCGQGTFARRLEFAIQQRMQS